MGRRIWIGTCAALALTAVVLAVIQGADPAWKNHTGYVLIVGTGFGIAAVVLWSVGSVYLDEQEKADSHRAQAPEGWPPYKRNWEWIFLEGFLGPLIGGGVLSALALGAVALVARVLLT